MAIAIYNPAKEITALGKAQSESANIGLKAAQTKSLADLAATQAKIEPEYYKQRNALSTNSQVAQKNFAEYMAQRGQNTPTGASGTMNQAEITRGASLQGGLGTLAAGQATANTENLRQVGEAKTAYNTGVAQSNATINAATMQSLITAQQAYNTQVIAQANADREFKVSEEQRKLDNAYRAQALAASRSGGSGGSGGGGGGGSSAKPLTTSAGTNAVLTDMNNIVNDRSQNYDDRMKAISNLAGSLSGSTGAQADYIQAQASAARAKIQAQKTDFVNSGRYAGYGEYLARK